MIKFIGRMLNSKNRIIENLFIFDSPDHTWDDEYLDKIRPGLARTFEIQSRSDFGKIYLVSKNV